MFQHGRRAGFLILTCSILCILSYSSILTAVTATSVCPSDSHSRANDIHGLPRLAFNGKLVSADIGTYDFITCDADGSGCEVNVHSSDISLSTQSSLPSSDPVVYVQSLVTYYIFGVCCAVVVVVFGFSLCCARYGICCYCGDANNGLCGGRLPTLRYRGCGFQRNGTKNEYPAWERWTIRAYMWLSVFFVFLWIGLAYFNGNRAVYDSTNDMIVAPNVFVTVAQSSSAPLNRFITDVSSGVLVDAVQNITNAFDDTANIHTIRVEVDNAYALAANLPDLTNVSAQLNALSPIIENITRGLNTTQIYVTTNLTAQTSALSNASTLLTTSLNNAVSSADGINGSLTATSATLTALDNAIAVVTNPLNGTQAILNDVMALSTLPSHATIVAVTNGTTASLAVLQQPSINPMPLVSDRASLIANLTAINNRIIALPNYNKTISNMISINITINTIITSNIPQVITTTNLLSTQLNLLINNITNFNNSLNHFIIQTNSLSFISAINQLILINQTISNIPSVTNINATINQIPQLQILLTNCIILIPQLNNISLYLLELPSSVNVLTTYVSVLSTSLTPAINAFNALSTNFSTFESTLYNTNIHYLINELQSAQLLAENTANALISNSFTLIIDQLSSTITSINISQALLTTQNLTNILQSALIPLSTITNFSTFEQSRDILQLLLTSSIADLSIWTVGYCLQQTPLTLCTLNSSCSSNICANIGVKRCAVSQNITCQADSACPLNDHCLVDTTRIAALSAALSNTQSPPTALLTATLAPLTSIATPSNVLSAPIAASQTSITNANANTLFFTAALASVINQANSYNSTDLSNELTSLSSSLTALNINSAVNSLSSLQSAYSTVQSSLPQLRDIATLIDTIDSFMHDAFPNVYANELSPAALAVASDGGSNLSNLTLAVASVLNQMSAFISTPTELSTLSFDAVCSSEKVRTYLELVFSNSAGTYGALYWIFSIVDEIRDTSHYGYIDPNGRYNYDSNGNEYGGDSSNYCLTDDCLKNTRDHYWYGTISGQTNDAVQVDESAQGLLSALLLVPLFVALLAAAATAFPCSWTASIWLANFSACCTYTLLPLIFIWATVFFPVVILQGDVCYGGASVVNSYIIQRRDNICGDIGGSGSAAACSFTLIENVTAVVDIPSVYADIINGDCSNNAVANAVNSISATADIFVTNKLVNFIQTQLNNASSSSSSSSGVSVQPLLENILISAADGVAPHVNELITELSSSTLSCSRLNNVYVTLQSSFCCNLTTGLYWMMGGWFLIAFTMCLCMGPAAILGRKRFGNLIPDSGLPLKYQSAEGAGENKPYIANIDLQPLTITKSSSGATIPSPTNPEVSPVRTDNFSYDAVMQLRQQVERERYELEAAAIAAATAASVAESQPTQYAYQPAYNPAYQGAYPSLQQQPPAHTTYHPYPSSDAKEEETLVPPPLPPRSVVARQSVSIPVNDVEPGSTSADDTALPPPPPYEEQRYL